MHCRMCSTLGPTFPVNVMTKIAPTPVKYPTWLGGTKGIRTLFPEGVWESRGKSALVFGKNPEG